MTPDQYCYNKAAPPGSAFYYSVRRLSASKRDFIVAIMAFYQEIEFITLNTEDLNLAQLKLNWWRDEIIKIQEGKPDHPVALALQQCTQSFAFYPDLFIKIIDGLEQNLTFPVFETFEESVIHIMRTAGARECLIARVLQGDEIVDAEIIYQFSLVLELVNYLQHARRYVRRGLIYFSRDELLKFQVTEEQLSACKTTDNIRHLLQFQAEKVERAYQKGLEALPSAAHGQLANILIRCEMARATLSAIRSSDFAVLENFIDITAIRRWWIAAKNA